MALDRTCAIFITLNPAYSGRVELPDNLKALFRPVAMVVPDFEMISRIMLLACGFQDASSLSEKVVLSLRLCREQLSSQGHYDFGMRTLKSLLAAAAALKRSQPAADEGALVRRVLDGATRPKVKSATHTKTHFRRHKLMCISFNVWEYCTLHCM